MSDLLKATEGTASAESRRHVLAAPADTPTPAVGLRELYRWFAPWLSGGLLVATALLGLLAASAAQSSSDLAVGLLTFGLAIVALARGIRNHFDGIGTALWSPALVTDAASLLILIFLLAGLAILGLVLAARLPGSAWQKIGYALFGASLAMIACNLKHYFDYRDRTRNRRDASRTP